ncbi:putative Ig domain-containing protein (plasmid) [Methylomonas sp. 2BW1-5-20]|uniref:putative Ig domain-containing protein n=1 Tax=Methylomonas sp. 2BW1-5-20 TaxID=3376686 RepID=UPI004052C158
MKRLMLGLWCLGYFVAMSAIAAPIDDARLKAVAWLITHQSGDGSWPSTTGLEMAETAAAVEALTNAGVTKSDTYTKGVAWLQNHQAYSTDTLARQIIALARSGRDTSTLVSRLIAWRNDEASPQSSWGAYDHYSTSYPDTAMALEAIKVSAASYAQEANTLCKITSQRNSDGGWPYFVSPSVIQPSRILSTAYSLIVLSRYQGAQLTCNGTNTDISSVLATGATWLKTQQKTPGGGFGEGSAGTVLETALAYRALVTILGATDPAAVNAQNFLIAQQQADGGWGGGDALLTTLTLAALPATTLADTDSDGLPDGVETQALLGTDPNLADSYKLAKGNGQSISGVTTAQSIAQATINQPFTATLTANGGTPPYTWTLTSGKLPDGLSLAPATGVISGTPTAIGTFNFVYQASAPGALVATAGQIEVIAAAVGGTQVPSVPERGLLLMGLLLLFTIRQLQKPKALDLR